MTRADPTGRPQDGGRRHRATGRPSLETASLLEGLREAMREEVRGLLVELRGKAPPPGLMDVPGGDARIRPALAERTRLWELAVKLGRELGEGIDGEAGTPARDGGPEYAPASRRRSRPEFGPDR